jgi:transposase-like protein
MIEETSTAVSKANGAMPPPLVAGKKRQFSAEFMSGVVARIKKGEAASSVGEEYQITPSVIRRWVKAAGGKAKQSKPLVAARKYLKRGAAPRKQVGVTVGDTGRKTYTEDFQRRAAKRLQAGESPIKLAASLGIHNSLLYNWAKKFDVAPTGHKGDPRFTKEFKRDIIKRFRNGERAEDLAKEQKVDKSTLYYWASREAGAPPAPSKLKREGAIVPGHMPSPIQFREGLGLLKKAKEAADNMQRAGELKELDEAHLLAQLALKSFLKAAP